MVPECMSVADFCDRYGVKKTLTYKLLNQGEIVAVKIGRRTLITRESAEAFYCRSIVQRWK